MSYHSSLQSRYNEGIKFHPQFKDLMTHISTEAILQFPTFTEYKCYNTVLKILNFTSFNNVRGTQFTLSTYSAKKTPSMSIINYLSVSPPHRLFR